MKIRTTRGVVIAGFGDVMAGEELVVPEPTGKLLVNIGKAECLDGAHEAAEEETPTEEPRRSRGNPAGAGKDGKISPKQLAKEFEVSEKEVREAMEAGVLDGAWEKNSRGHVRIDLEKAQQLWPDEDDLEDEDEDEEEE